MAGLQGLLKGASSSAGPLSGGGRQGTINRVRPDDRIYRIGDREVGALKVRDVSTANDRARVVRVT